MTKGEEKWFFFVRTESSENGSAGNIRIENLYTLISTAIRDKLENFRRLAYATTLSPPPKIGNKSEAATSHAAFFLIDVYLCTCIFVRVFVYGTFVCIGVISFVGV